MRRYNPTATLNIFGHIKTRRPKIMARIPAESLIISMILEGSEV